jgi:hypothetical protein
LRLTLNDRTRAVNRILDDHPEWSDRRIAEACAVASKTVVQLREGRKGRYGELLSRPEVRVGKDGRCRPVKSGLVRDEIVRALEANPTGSLRSIAVAVGVSPETVRSVRKRSASMSVESTLRPMEDATDVDHQSIVLPIGFRTEKLRPVPWQLDSALSSRADALEFAKWFEASAVGEECRGHAEAVPVNRIYEVVDEARRRARRWEEFARNLEQRIPRPSR